MKPSASHEPTTKRAVGYIRVSERGGRSGPEYHTLEIQRASIERVCRDLGYKLIDIYTEENWSGADDRRPRFREALERTMRGEADAIAVWKVSRFSRSWAQAARDTESLIGNGKDLLSGEEGFDTSTTGGRMLMRLLFVLAEWERDVLGEQFEVIKDRVVDRGSHLGRTPTGYLRAAAQPSKPWHVGLEDAKTLVAETDFEPVTGMLIPDPKLAPVVRQVYERRRAGASYADLVRFMDDVAPRADGGLWGTTQIKRMLSLPVYLGEVAQRSRDERGRVIAERVNPSAHAPLVSRELWAAVQNSERGALKRAPEGEGFPLSGKVYCAACSWRMAGNNRAVRPGRRVRVYQCPGKRGTGTCPAPSTITAEILESIVADRASSLFGAIAQTSSGAMPDLDAVEARIAEADQALADLASLDARRELGSDWLPMMGRLRKEKVRLERERDDGYAAAGEVRETLRLESLDAEARWTALRGAAEAIFVRRGPQGGDSAARVHVVWKGDEVPPLGGPDNRIRPTPFLEFEDLDSASRPA